MVRLPLPRTREIPDTDYGCEIFSAHWFNAIVAGALKWTGYLQLRIRRRARVLRLRKRIQMSMAMLVRGHAMQNSQTLISS